MVLEEGGILSGNLTSNSMMRSPRCSGFLGYGSPSPGMRRLTPGFSTSLKTMGMLRPSSVGVFTVQPHSAWMRAQTAAQHAETPNPAPKHHLPPPALTSRRLILAG